MYAITVADFRLINTSNYLRNSVEFSFFLVVTTLKQMNAAASLSTTQTKSPQYTFCLTTAEIYYLAPSTFLSLVFSFVLYSQNLRIKLGPPISTLLFSLSGVHNRDGSNMGNEAELPIPGLKL